MKWKDLVPGTVFVLTSDNEFDKWEGSVIVVSNVLVCDRQRVTWFASSSVVDDQDFEPDGCVEADMQEKNVRMSIVEPRQ